MDSNGRKTSFMKYYPYNNLLSSPKTHPSADNPVISPVSIDFLYLDEVLPPTTAQLRFHSGHYLPRRLHTCRVSNLFKELGVTHGSFSCHKHSSNARLLRSQSTCRKR